MKEQIEVIQEFPIDHSAKFVLGREVANVTNFWVAAIPANKDVTTADERLVKGPMTYGAAIAEITKLTQLLQRVRS